MRSAPPVTEAVSDQGIFGRLKEWSARHPDQTAFVVDHPDGIEEYRYPDVLRFAECIASALKKQGIDRGDRVGIVMDNIPQWVFALLGVMRLGAVAVPLATAWPEPSLRRVVEHSGCRLIFADAENAAKAIRMGVTVVAFKSNEQPAVAWEDFVSAGESKSASFSPGAGDETVILVYTSGTTGDPKAVQLTARNLSCEIEGVIEPLEISPDHRILSVLPFSHVLPLIANGLGPLWAGAAVVFLSSISPQRIVEAFHKHRITLFICVPQFFYLLHNRIFDQAAAQPLPLRMVFRLMFRVAGRIHSPALRRKIFGQIHRKIGPQLRLFISGGSRFDPRVAEDLSRLGYVVTQSYGLTETSAAATVTPLRENVIGTVGKPLRGVSIRIDSPDANGTGEVWIRGPIVMKGYYRDEEATRRVMTDGWFHSGDLGCIRPDGNLVITGRSKDVIVLPNGENIYPEEMETHYTQSPFIKELCVLGIPEDAAGPSGEKLHAVVVPDMEEFKRRGQTAMTEMIRFALENLSKQLPSYQRVLSFSIRNEPFPRTVTRKLKRFEILEDELARRITVARPRQQVEHRQFTDGVGAVVAELVREAKPNAGPLDVSMNIELDLGFDSLDRVELLGLAEARLGAGIDEKEAARIFTLGELIEALRKSQNLASGRGRNWKEILSRPDPVLENHEVFTQFRLTRFAAYLSIKIIRAIALALFRLRSQGLEKLPKDGPYIICPNHESYLDGPLLISVLPKRVIDRVFVLGYSDYFEGSLMRHLGKFCNIISIDPNVNLVRAMQVGAAGIRQGRVLVVFPEGTRSIDGHVAEFKKGAAILARELGVPVVPVGIRGGFETWPRAGSFRLHPIEFIFGDPIHPGAFANATEPYGALTEALREEVKRLADDV